MRLNSRKVGFLFRGIYGDNRTSMVDVEVPPIRLFEGAPHLLKCSN
jgi:hypothetical protein